MAFQKISEPAAFSPGAALWIMPDAENSNWAQKADWYLNFQMLRADQHREPQINDDFKSLLKDEGLEPPTTFSNPQMPLMLASHHRLPVEHTISVPFSGDLKAWLKAVGETWKGLNYPSLRLFLPRGEKPADVSSAWKPEKPNVDIGLVADRSSPE